MKVVNAVLTSLILVLSASMALAGDQAGLPYEFDRQSTDEADRNRTSPSFEASAAFADSNAEYLGSTLWNSPHDVVVEGAYAYCAFPTGLAIFDISNPSQPALVSTVYLPKNALPYGEMEKWGNYIYITLWTSLNGLAIIDVSDPLNPFVATMYGFWWAKHLTVQDTLVFLYGWSPDQFWIINVADPLNPDSLSSGYGETLRDGFAIDTLFLAGARDLIIWNISDPAAPDSLGFFPLKTENGVWSIQALDTVVYAIDGFGNFHSFGISNPAIPDSIGNYNPPGFAYKIQVVDSLAFILSRTPQGLHVLNVKDPAAPDSIGSFMDSLGSIKDLYVLDSMVYLVNSGTGFKIVDVSDAANPVLQGSHSAVAEVWNVSVLDSLAYVACVNSGVQIVNITDPTAPTPIGSYQAGNVLDVQAVDSLAYVATGDGLTILNVADPANPDSIGGLGLGGSGRDVFVVNSLAYVAAADAGLYIIDVSDPTNPDSIAHWDATESTLLHEVVVVDSLAYLADNNGLIILNVADSANPQSLSYLPTWQEEFALSLAVRDTIVYLGLDGVGFWVVNVADPMNPDTIAWYDNGDIADAIYIQDSLAYITAWDRGIEIVNISNPASPVKVGFHNTPGYAEGIFVRDSIVYVADKSSLILLKTPFGLAVGVDDEPGPDLLPSGFGLSQNHPNPFNPSTTIDYYLPRRSHVELTVHNLLGQRVVTLVNETQPYGQQTVKWNGKDSRGNSVASGVYLYRIKADGFTESRKMVLLK